MRSPKLNYLGAILTVASLASLVACGGGGGSGESSSPPPTVTPPPPPPEPQDWSVSGSISVLSEAVLDGDTNNPDNPVIENDTVSTAQAAPNPSTIGGFLADGGAAEPGALGEAGDIDDYFRIQARAGQRVSMVIADSEAADLDLYLYNEDGFIEAFSAGIDDLEQVTIPADGIWTINPSVYDGASSYTLSVGADTRAQASSDIHPGQLIVRLRDESILRPHAAEQRAGDVALRVNAEWQGGGIGRERLLQLGATHLRGALPQHVAEKRQLLKPSPELQARWQTWQAAKQLSRLPEVERVETNALRSSTRVTNDAFAGLQWSHAAIGLPGAWEFTTGDTGVVVAVVDSGVITDHPDLAGQLTGGYDFVADTNSSGDGDGLDTDPSDEGPLSDEEIGNYSYHGTHVSGIVAAAGDNNVGVAGIAFGARVMPLRALSGDTGSSYDVLQAIRYAAGLDNDSGRLPDHPAQIINLSLGGSSASNSEQELIDQVTAAGTVVVAAAGNRGVDALDYPAGYDSVIAVGATDLEGRVTAYSNTGAGLDLVAPGGDGSNDRNGDGYPDAILSTGMDDGTPAYTFLSGTSMAAPAVSGVIALMQSVNPTLDAAGVTALLEQGAMTVDLGIDGYDTTHGWGLVDAQKALFAALDSMGETPQRPPRLVASTTAINLGATLDSVGIRLDNRGTSALGEISSASSSPWLSVGAVNTDANGLGQWRVNVDRTGLSEGQYEGQVRFSSPVNDVSIDVSMRVGGDGQGDVGVIYVLFYDPDTDTVAFQASTSAAQGYRFNGEVPEGNYEIWAGTDTDNDLMICDAGDACGAYKTLDEPIRVNVDRQIEGLDFSSGYQIQLRGVSQQDHGLLQPARNLRRLR
ncbi:MAG: S8 family serine peptidase [Halieaceae bacterium]|nr:S8 family serine peptidase [Halieaceae bacterium]